MIRQIIESAAVLADVEAKNKDGALKELLAAAQSCDFHALESSAPLQAVRALVRASVPHMEDDRHFHPDIEKAIAMVRSGALAEAAGAVALPEIFPR